MAAGEAAGDRWRDEDGLPSPAEEFGEEDWWVKYERSQEPITFPHDHGSYLRELYDEIAQLRQLRNAVRDLIAGPTATGRRESDLRWAVRQAYDQAASRRGQEREAA
jgi:hypothetical protein